MRGKFTDMTGWKMWEHGVPDSRLTVIERAEDYIDPSGHRQAQWLCECACKEHNKIVVYGSHLKNGHTKSCGCLGKEKISLQNKKYNTYYFYDDIVIGLTSNTGVPFCLDRKNFNKIKDICWREVKIYGMPSIQGLDTKTGKTARMHVCFGFKNYDHIDRNELNNLESNLRPATKRQNSINRNKMKNNTSGFIGVYFDRNKWRARINDDNGRLISLGCFDNKEDALIARLRAEQKYYGEFAPQRHLFEQYGILSKKDDDNELQ